MTIAPPHGRPVRTAVRVVLETENRVVNLAREEVDGAIRVGVLPDSDPIARKLGRIALWPCTGPAYLAGRGVPERPEAPANYDLLGWQDRPSEWRFTDEAGLRHVVAVPAGNVAPEPAVLAVLLAGCIGVADRRISSPGPWSTGASSSAAAVVRDGKRGCARGLPSAS